MSEFVKKNINRIIVIFLIIQPFLDVLTGICVNTLKLNITIGVIVRVIFLLFLCAVVIFIFKKKKLLVPYFIIGLYFILYTIGMLVFKDSSILIELKNLIRTFYLPILFMTIYSIKDEIKISNMTLFTVLLLYLLLLFIPTLFGLGYDAYEITKSGKLGFFNSANELSGIISILTPIMFIILKDQKNYLKIVLVSLIYLVVILMIGTKTPLLSLILTLGTTMVFVGINLFKNKKFKLLITSLLVVLLGTISVILVIPRTNFYKNIRVHLDYLELDSIVDVFKDKEYIDHFIFSSRLKFMENKAKIYHKASFYEKAFGIGYINKNKETKLIEMDYFDIYYSHGFVGFIIYFSILIYLIYKCLSKYKVKNYNCIMQIVSLFLIIFLSFFTGHIITSPSVSIVAAIIFLSFIKKEKKELLFASYNMDFGGIEKALLELTNKIDYKKYNVTIILEEKKGVFLNKLNKQITVKELKVSNNKNILIRKLINELRKTVYAIFNYKTYDFSCCYATYSYSCSRLALASSNNTAFFVHSDYKNIYKKEDDFRQFFDSRNIDKYRKIIFVSNETKKDFVKIYRNLEGKCCVCGNFLDIKEIKKQSNIKIKESKKKDKKLFLYVGRFDEETKKITRQIELTEKIEDIELWLVGDGPDRNLYEDLVTKKHLEDRVKFMGSQSNPYKYMKKADYVILTSEHEGFGIVLVESLIVGTKIITTCPLSDDLINLKDYAYIISKDTKKMIEEVKKVISDKKKLEPVDFESLQKERMKRLELIFDEVV